MAYFPAHCDNDCKDCSQNSCGWCVWKDIGTPFYKTEAFTATAKVIEETVKQAHIVSKNIHFALDKEKLRERLHNECLCDQCLDYDRTNKCCKNTEGNCQILSLLEELNKTYNVNQDTNDEPHLFYNVINDRICGNCGGMSEEDCISSECFVHTIKEELLGGKYNL